MFFRRGASSGRWLHVRMGIFGVGALLALMGMGLHHDWLIWAAAIVLASGILLGLVARRQGEPRQDD